MTADLPSDRWMGINDDARDKGTAQVSALGQTRGLRRWTGVIRAGRNRVRRGFYDWEVLRVEAVVSDDPGENHTETGTKGHYLFFQELDRLSLSTPTSDTLVRALTGDSQRKLSLDRPAVRDNGAEIEEETLPA